MLMRIIEYYKNTGKPRYWFSEETGITDSFYSGSYLKPKRWRQIVVFGRIKYKGV